MIEALIEVVVGGLNGNLPGKMIIHVWRRLTLVAMRLSFISTRPIKSGGTRETLLAREPRQREPRPEPQHKPFRLPTGHAWLVRLLPEAQDYADQLQSMLMEPEMAALRQTRPGIDRLLRPLCRMLGVKLAPKPTKFSTATPPLNPMTHPRPVPTPPRAAPIPAPAQTAPVNPSGRVEPRQAKPAWWWTYPGAAPRPRST